MPNPFPTHPTPSNILNHLRYTWRAHRFPLPVRLLSCRLTLQIDRMILPILSWFPAISVLGFEIGWKNAWKHLRFSRPIQNHPKEYSPEHKNGRCKNNQPPGMGIGAVRSLWWGRLFSYKIDLKCFPADGEEIDRPQNRSWPRVFCESLWRHLVFLIGKLNVFLLHVWLDMYTYI